MAAHKRAPSLGNAVQYKKDGKTQKEETSATAPVEPPDPEDSNVQKPASNKKGKKNVAASKRKKSIIKTKANGVGGGKEEKKQTDTIAGESSILTDVIPEGDEASAATDEVTVESIISGKRLRNQANAMTDVTETATPRILEAPKKTNLMVRRRTSGKINLTGLAMPNSVAVVNLQSMSDKNKFHHRRESQALLDIVDANGNASSSRATKNFALPQHLRSRRKKEDSIIALNLGTPGKPSDNPELAEELEDSPPHSPEPELNSNFLKSVVAIHKPESKLNVTEATTLFRIDTPPKSKKPASPAIQAKSTSASQEIVPEILLIPDEESSSPLGSRSKTQTRDPSIIAIEIREPSIHDISTNLDASLDMSDFMSRSLLRSKVPSKVPSMEFLPRIKSNRDIVGKRAVYTKKTAAIERHPSEPALLPPISLSAKSSLADLERPVHINLDAQKLLMAQKAWSLLEIAQQQDISEPTSGSFETLNTVKLSKAELLDEVTARDWFPGLNGKEANISNILEITMKVMKAGYWREKMEAAKATLYLYHTFENDLPNAVQDIILPQLDFLNDERWEVRAQFAMALGAYKVNHPEITLALISKLNDPSDAVKKAVKNSLATFGISSKEALRNVMGSLGLIPHITKKQKIDEDWLDVLLEKMRVEAEAEQQVTDDRIELWRRNVRNPRNTERLPSICTTLTYNPKNITRLSSEEKVVHDLLHQNLNTRLSSSIRASIAEVAALQARSKSQSLNKKNSIPNTLMDSLAQMHSHMNLK
ncbi:hypothetical protein BDR26DRAFT_918525 [Obelidium mucronatum]|nr:hypothetical protein BDR26DRAFT_918525 [Obelidium mucronatum]